MKGSEFVKAYGSKGAAAWEAAAFDLARAGGNVAWPMKTIAYDCPDGHRVQIDVASDYFAIGEDTSDYLLLPLSPNMAQRIADLHGYLLPTPKLALEVWRAAEVKLTPTNMVPNKYADMAQFAEHNLLVQKQLAGTPSTALRSGHKKDVVIGNLYKPGKVLIYGWMKPDAPMTGKDTAPSMTAPWRVQPYSNIHGEFYFDYSHGIRFVSPSVTIDGTRYDTDHALTDKTLASCLSDEGPLKSPRYPSAGGAKGGVASLLTPNKPGYAVYGLHLLRNGIVT